MARQAFARHLLISLSSLVLTPACAKRIRDKVIDTPPPRSDRCDPGSTAYPLPGRGPVCLSKDYVDFLGCLAEGGVSKVVTDKAAEDVVSAGAGYSGVEGRANVELEAASGLQVEYEAGDTKEKKEKAEGVRSCNDDFRHRRGLPPLERRDATSVSIEEGGNIVVVGDGTTINVPAVQPTDPPMSEDLAKEKHQRHKEANLDLDNSECDGDKSASVRLCIPTGGRFLSKSENRRGGNGPCTCSYREDGSCHEWTCTCPEKGGAFCTGAGKSINMTYAIDYEE